MDQYYNSFHSIVEFLKQGKGILLLDSERLRKAQKAQTKDSAEKKSRILQLLALAKVHGVAVEERPPASLQDLLPQKHYRGYILKAGETRQKAIGDILRTQPPLVLLLDGVLDAGNFGAIVRSADLFGAAAIFCKANNVGNTANQLARSSAGAAAWVPQIEINLLRAATQLKAGGYWLYGADMQGEDIAQVEFVRPCALVMGAEETGIHAQLRQLCDKLVQIPTTGHIDSLNVSAAAAILMYEIQRQSKSQNPNK